MKRFLAVVGAVGVLLGLAPTAADAATVPPRVERVFVFSVPALDYRDVTARTMPNLHAFLAESAIADLSVRVDDTSPSIADSYATIAAGARTRGATRDAGWAFNADETLGAGTAGEEYTRRTGTPADGELVYLAQPSLQAANRDALFGAEIGALGDALERDGRARAVIANADTVQGSVQYERTAMTGLADGTGRVPEGRLDDGLLMPDPQAAFGLRLDPAAVQGAFTEAWQPRSVVLVEASDLWRAELAAATDPGTATTRYARTTSDALFGELLRQVDPARDAVLVVGPRFAGDQLALTIAALRAPGIDEGYLTSATTRRPGFVQLVDVAPTVLELSGVPVPDAMEGRTFTAVPGPAGDARRSALIDANRAAQFRDGIIGLVTAAWIIGQVVLCAAAVMVFAFPRLRPGSRVLAPAALGLLAVPLGIWIAGLFPFFRWGAGAYLAFLVGVAVLVAGVAYLGLRRSPLDPALGVLGALVALLVLDVVTGAHLQFNTVFGYSPTIAGRFAGIGNLAYAVLGAATIFLAGLLAHRIGGPRGRIVAAVLLVAVCLVDGLPFFGADVGGMLSLVPASAVLLWLLAGRRIRVRTVVIGGLATLLVVTIVGFADLARPAASRTHLGRLFERIGDQGWEGFWTIIQRKASANLGVLGLSIWTLLLPVLFVLLGVFLYRAPGRLREVQQAIPELRATLVAFGVLAVLGFALNDSGIAIPGVMLGVANAVLVYLCVRVPAPTSIDLREVPDEEFV